MRDQLQKQTDPTKPNVGIDANRDYYLSLSSNRTFLKFINTICSGLIISQSNIIEATREKREEIATKILSRDVRVLMLHGYDIGERVYGPYWVDSRDSNNWKVDTTDSDKAHIDKIIGNEGLRITSGRRQGERYYVWDDTWMNPKYYQGEWSRRLYFDCHVWGCDIELDKTTYDEGVRGPDSNRPYTPLLIGSKELPYFQEGNNTFLTFLRNYSWP
jgi:hypothetical protein